MKWWQFVLLVVIISAAVFFINLWSAALGNNRSISAEWNSWWSNEQAVEKETNVEPEVQPPDWVDTE